MTALTTSTLPLFAAAEAEPVPAFAEALDELNGVYIVTPAEYVTDPNAARVMIAGQEMVIQSLYDPDQRPLFCPRCNRVTMHRTRAGRAECGGCE